jgi:lysophospholipase L1-like esterase
VGKDVRAADGFHLNVTGAEILALDIAEAVKDDLRARGAKI